MSHPDPQTSDAELNRRLGETIERNPDLHRVYLSRGDPFSGGDRVSSQSKLKFLLWFAVFGKARFPNICHFDDRILDILNTRLPSGLTLLQDYIHTIPPDASPDSPLAAIASSDAVTRFRLGPFVPVAGAGTPALDARLARLRRHGISIVGFPLHTLGIGEDARSLFKVFRSLGIPVSLTDVGNAGMEPIVEKDDYAAFLHPRPLFPTVVFCMPLFEQARVCAEWGPGALNNRRVIGYWPWELTAVDPCWGPAFAEVDEIWASSTFLAKVYGQSTTQPVIHMPMLVDAALPDRGVLRRYGLPEGGFTFLAFADLNSTLKRKNVLGAIAAFKQAFAGHGGDVRLLLKTTHLERRVAEAGLLTAAIGDDDRIMILDGPLSRAETLGLLDCADVFVSLHRAEGFGRVLAEAMTLGTPVIATDWSGSQDLVQADTGYPIRCQPVLVAPEDYPEAAGLWAEPDLAHAAEVMRALHADPGQATDRIARARAHVGTRFSLAAVAGAVTDRLARIHCV